MKGFYNTAFIKFIVMCLFTLLLHILCLSGLSVIAWFIVFIPIIMMTVIATLLLYYFGINLKSGDLNVPDDTEKNKNRELLFKEHPTIINLPNNKVRDSRYSSGLMYVS
jgi:glucan phosphoethanolaminetransferase (alkaline phosphatase superfamily)